MQKPLLYSTLAVLNEDAKMLDRLTSMAAFVAAAEEGSFAAAAIRLKISPQMVAKHVVFLEDRLGARLLNRTTRSQSLTELGRRYLDQCRVVLAEAAAADKLANDAKARPRGRLRITAPVTFGNHRLMSMITRYLRRYPEVEIDLDLTDRCVDLVEESFEVAFRIGPLANSALIARALSPYRLIACAAPSYLERSGDPETPADLARHECLGYAYWARPTDREWTFTRNGETHRVRVKSRLRVNDSAALRRAALEGYGVTLGAEDLLEELIASGRLRRILASYEGPSRPLHLLYAPDRRRMPKVWTFIETALQEFSGVLKPDIRACDRRAEPPS